MQALYVTNDGVTDDGGWYNCYIDDPSITAFDCPQTCDLQPNYCWYYNSCTSCTPTPSVLAEAAPLQYTWVYQNSAVTPAGTVLTRDAFVGVDGAQAEQLHCTSALRFSR